MRIFSIGMLLCLTALAAEPVLLTFDGVGVIKFGMTVDQAERLIDSKAIVEPDYTTEACSYVKFSGYDDIGFMVENGIIVRADVGGGVSNVVEVAVNQSIDSVTSRYKNAITKPNFYDSESHDVWLMSPNGAGVILLEESGGLVRSIRAGIEPAVGYVEGCL